MIYHDITILNGCYEVTYNWGGTTLYSSWVLGIPTDGYQGAGPQIPETKISTAAAPSPGGKGGLHWGRGRCEEKWTWFLVGTHNMRTYDVYPYIYIFLFFCWGRTIPHTLPQNLRFCCICLLLTFPSAQKRNILGRHFQGKKWVATIFNQGSCCSIWPESFRWSKS